MSKRPIAISVDNLTVKYGGFVAAENISFNVFSNEVFGLLGPNGAGKTSILRVLTTIMKPAHGKAVVGSYDVAKNVKAIRPLIGVVPESFALYNYLTARENLLFFSKPYNLTKELQSKNIERISAILKIQDRLDDKILTFSSGMKQKISIACAVIHDPKFLFMDEPTIGLDPKIRRTIWKLIADLKEKMTIFMTTHYLEEAEQICDNVAIINQGHIVAQGNPLELNQLHNVQCLEEVFIKCTGEE